MAHNVYISRASKQDLPAIKELLHQYAKFTVEAYHLTKRDLAFMARLESGELVGFMWVGLMANNKIAYVDKVTIHPKFHKQGILQKLYAEAFKQAFMRGVEFAEGYIRQDQFHEASGVQALRMAFGGDSLPYTRVFAQVQFIAANRPDLVLKEGDN
jgi:N-acetylglutamate synthase-like GNAT family acetyltransferase